jgi:hypothetical protein
MRAPENEIDPLLHPAQVAKLLAVSHRGWPSLASTALGGHACPRKRPGYGGHDTRLWGRFIMPLWLPPAAPAPSMMYRKG